MLYINPTITLTEPIAKKQLGYMINFDPKQPDKLLIKCRNAKGRGLGIVGTVDLEGNISTTNKTVWKYITTQVKTKIAFAVDAIKNNNIYLEPKK